MRLFVAIWVLLSLTWSVSAAEDLVVRPSKYTVKETLDRLTVALEKKGLRPFARIDHGAAAKASGLELRPTEVLLFGNPKLGTRLMQANRHVAIDLPMKVLAWEDDASKVWIAYTPPKALTARYKIEGHDEVVVAMEKALEALATAASN